MSILNIASMYLFWLDLLSRESRYFVCNLDLFISFATCSGPAADIYGICVRFFSLFFAVCHVLILEIN